MRLYPPFALIACEMLVLAFVVAPGPADASVAGEEAFAELLSAGADAERRHDPETALEYYRQAEALRPADAYVLQKIAQQLSDSLFLAGDGAGKQHRERVREALDYAKRAAELDPTSAVNRLSVSILYGRLAATVGVAEKIDYARQVRRHAEEALALDPEYAWACHVLGRWHVEMAAVGGHRRAVAAVLFGGLPKASRDEGIAWLERAVGLEPASIAHRVELGFAYAAARRRDAAREQWRQAVELPAVAIYDEPARARAHEALRATAE